MSLIKKTISVCLLVAVAPIARAQQIIVIHFEANSSKVPESAYTRLDTMAATVLKTLLTDVKINGYSDAAEDDADHTLAAQRATNVRAYLLHKNLNGVSFETKAYGSNFPVDSNNDESANAKNRRVEVVVTMSMEPVDTTLGKMLPPAVGQVIQFPDIHFQPGSSDFLPGSAPKLLEILRMMQKYPTLKIEIGGHCCCSNFASFNGGYDEFLASVDAISKHRAEAVLQFLVVNGIAESRITAVGYGGRKPLVSELDEADRITNRRIEVKVISN